jgi:hypothetical protein
MTTANAKLERKKLEDAVLEQIGRMAKATVTQIAEAVKEEPRAVNDIIRDGLKPKGLVANVFDESSVRFYFLTDLGKTETRTRGFELPGDSSETDPRDEEVKAEAKLERASISALRQIKALHHEPDKLVTEAQEDLVLQAIDEKYRTYGGIKKRVGFPASYNIEGLLAGMCLAKGAKAAKLRRESKADLTGFFRYESKPLNFWRIGDGRIDAEFDPDFKPRDEIAKAEEMSTWRIMPETAEQQLQQARKPQVLEEVGEMPETFREELVGDPGPVAQNKGRQPRPLDLETVEKLAAALKTKESIARALGFTRYPALKARLDKDEDLRNAYERGRERRKESRGFVNLPNRRKPDTQGETPPAGEVSGTDGELPNVPPAEKYTPNAIPVEGLTLGDESIERLARAGYSARQVAAHFQIPYEQFRDGLRGHNAYKWMSEPWYRGKGGKKEKPKTEATEDASAAEKKIITRGDLLVDDGLLEAVEDMNYNLATAVLCIRDGRIGSAIWHLEREQARRERAV